MTMMIAFLMMTLTLASLKSVTNVFICLIADDVPYIWTSGRLCDFKGCEGRKDLEPKNLFGWFWSANREKISPTNQVSKKILLFHCEVTSLL